jgi:rare lipoprotein A
MSLTPQPFVTSSLERRASLTLGLLFCLLLAACTAQPRFTDHQPARRSKAKAARQAKATQGEWRAGQVLSGTASWYGPGFHGKKTASGDVFDMNGMSAAHRELPLGTWLQVKSLDTGRKVEVLVNDRGPFKSGRMLDLSKGAAERLGMLETGTARIEARILTLP